MRCASGASKPKDEIRLLESRYCFLEDWGRGVRMVKRETGVDRARSVMAIKARHCSRKCGDRNPVRLSIPNDRFSIRNESPSRVTCWLYPVK